MKERNRTFKTVYGMIHCIAHCKVCDWIDEGLSTAKKMARQHSSETGHSVAIEVGTAYDIVVGKSNY